MTDKSLSTGEVLSKPVMLSTDIQCQAIAHPPFEQLGPDGVFSLCDKKMMVFHLAPAFGRNP